VPVEERDIRPIIALPKQRRAKNDESDLAAIWRVGAPHVCMHGPWEYVSTDYQRGATKWRCPTGECSPKTKWVKASRLHPLIPRRTKKWKRLYGHGRAAIEGFNSKAKERHALNDLRSRGIVRATRHMDMCIIAMMARELALARAGPATA
jgi:hypothetical protein